MLESTSQQKGTIGLIAFTVGVQRPLEVIHKRDWVVVRGWM
jgi:hypothetical protein